MKLIRIGLFTIFFVTGFVSPLSAQNMDSLRTRLEKTSDDSLKAHVYVALAEAYLERMDLDHVLESTQKGIEFANRNNDTLAITLNLEYVGVVTYYFGLYEKSLSVYFTVQKNADQLNRKDIAARAYRMMGWIDIEMNEYESSLENFKIAKKYFSTQQGASEEVALAQWGMGEILYKQGRIKESKQYLDSAIHEKPGLKSRELGFVLTEMGNLLRDEEHDYLASEKILRKAQKELEPSKANRDVYAWVMAELSLTYQAQGKRKEAKAFAVQAYELYSKVPFRRRYIGIYKVISTAFSSVKDYEMAYIVQQEMHTLSDSIFYRRNQFLIADARVQYESEKQRNENSLLKQKLLTDQIEDDNRFRLMIIIAVSSILILLLASALFILRSRYQLKIAAVQFQNKIRKERERIGRELHDSLGGQLSSISIGLNRLLKGGNGHAVQAIQDIADKALSEFRDSLWIMDKETISIGEIEQRVNNLFWQYKKIEIPIEMQIRVQESLLSLRLFPSNAGNLYRIIQEAVNNSVKHSRATMFQIDVDKAEGGIRITISDNGIGIDPKILQQGEHYGIKNMKIRAEQMNAALTINTYKHGTQIQIVIEQRGSILQ